MVCGSSTVFVMGKKVGKAVKPSPNTRIVKTWHGCLEIFLRLAVLLSACGAIVASAFALSKLDDITDAVRLAIIALRTANGDDPDPDPLIKNSTIAAGVGIAVGGVVILLELMGILQRFCNIHSISKAIKIFLSLDVILSFVWAVGFFAAGVLAADSAKQWADLADTLDRVPLVQNVFNLLLSTGILPELRTVLAATAGATLFAGLLTSLLMVWIICTLIKSW